MTTTNCEYTDDIEQVLFRLIKKHTGREPTEQEMRSCKAEVIKSGASK